MLAIFAAVAALSLAHGPAHHRASKPAPAPASGPAWPGPVVKRPDPGQFMSPEGNGGGWQSRFMAAPVHPHPHPPLWWQPASFEHALPAPIPARRVNMPRHDLTPGVTTDLSTSEVCTKKWGKDARHVDANLKARVFQRYGFGLLNKDPKCIPDAHGARCEIDHLISRELGGADDLQNLWPQPYGGPWNAHMKDRLENRLHVEVCAGRLSLLQAQAMIRDDWQDAYRRYFGDPQ